MLRSRLTRSIVVGFAGLAFVACANDDAQVKQVGATATAGCKRNDDSESADRLLAVCLTGDDPAIPPAPADPAESKAITVFVDRSASMAGFLDPAYPTRLSTDYRSVIDRVLIGLRASTAFSFGAAVREIDANLGTLGSRDFYSDRDTRTEDVLAVVTKDTSATRSYVIVTDGRRGSPNTANAQYVAMRALADRWISRGGSFFVAVSMAPFKTVPSDPSGCTSGTGAGADQRCPLYAFVYAAPGSAPHFTSSLGSSFEHVFQWPAARVAATSLAFLPIGTRTGVRIEQTWPKTSRGARILRSRADSATTRWTSVRLALVDTTSPTGHGDLVELRSQGIQMVVSSRLFGDVPSLPAWGALGGKGVILRPTPDSVLSFDVVSRGAASPPTLYRIDLMPTGVPSWIDAFDAADASDRVRTYGIGRLFESFRQQGLALSHDVGAITRFYVLAN